MTAEEYLAQVSELLKLQIEKNMVLSDESIENFKKIKPVSLTVQLIEVLNRAIQKEDFSEVYHFERGLSISSNYPQLKEVLDVIQSIYIKDGKLEDAERLDFTKCFLSNNIDTFCAKYDKLEEECKSIIEKEKDTLEELLKILYTVEDTVALGILSDFSSAYSKVFEELNMGFLLEELADENAKFVLVANESNEFLVELVASNLEKKGKEVFLIKKPLCYENDEIAIKDTVAISIENIQVVGNLSVIHPIKLISQSKGEEDNISYLLEYINNHYNQRGHMNVIGQGYQIDEISVRPFTNKKMMRLSQFYYEKREYNLALARYGDYLAYISKIYKVDCRALLYKKPTKKFSIVVPARDSVDTLQYTVKTCLEQTYTGDFEVVISDNSVENTKVYDFCKELNDPKITYIKTPRSLSLAKSFEFAYLHTSGEFVFSVGSDDGVLPWTLEALESITSKFPEESVIQWPRGFYAWPGFNYGQQHQFDIPNDCTPRKYVAFHVESDAYLQRILDNPRLMYTLPLLYINSGFRRAYMEEMYEKMGELFDGNSQDLYTGIAMVALNERILNVSLPLTIAGMSSRSVGANADKAENFELKTKLVREIADVGNMGMNVQTMYEHLVPLLGSDVSALYFALMRSVSKGLFSTQILETRLDWKAVFENMVNCLRIQNFTYYEDVYKLRYAAALQGEEFLRWFDETLLVKAMTLCILDEEAMENARKQRTYKCGKDEFQIRRWDASEYGVQNIHDAVKLYCELVEEV